MIREEGYGIMYVLADNTRVVVKNPSNNRDNTLSKGDFSPLTCIALGIVQASVAIIPYILDPLLKSLQHFWWKVTHAFFKKVN